MWNRYTTKVIRYTCPPIFIAVIIFYLCCLVTADDVPDVVFFEHTDKIVHFLMYFGLTGIAAFGYIYGEKGRVLIWKLVAFTVILPVLYGGLIEILQSWYFDGRSGDWFDFLADASGSLTAFFLALYYRRTLLNRQ